MKPPMKHIKKQVHRATLLTGESVVVKVQRPGLRRLFEIDLEVLGGLAAALDKQQDQEASFVIMFVPRFYSRL